MWLYLVGHACLAQNLGQGQGFGGKVVRARLRSTRIAWEGVAYGMLTFTGAVEGWRGPLSL